MWCDSLAGDPEYLPLSVPAPCTLLALDNNMDTGHGEWRVDTGHWSPHSRHLAPRSPARNLRHILAPGQG